MSDKEITFEDFVASVKENIKEINKELSDTKILDLKKAKTLKNFVNTVESAIKTWEKP